MADFSPDEQLISAYREGDEEAATELFERYYQRLIELIRRQMGWRLKQVEGSVDVAQSVLRSFFSQLRDKQVTVGPDDDLWPLLVTVALNKIRNRGKFWSRQRRDPQRQSPLVEALAAMAQTAATALQYLRRDVFVSAAAHALRTPMTPILGYAELLIGRQVGDAQRTEWLGYVHDATTRALKVVDDRGPFRILPMLCRRHATSYLFQVREKRVLEHMDQLAST